MTRVTHSGSNIDKVSAIIKYLMAAGLFLLINLNGWSQSNEYVYLGSIIKSGSTDDESFGPYNIGFDFTFFGDTYNQFYISSNGLVLFGEGSTSSDEAPIPTVDVPNNFIAPLWDDLIISSSGKMLYTTVGASPNRKLIIQATNMGFWPNPIFMGTYLVILYETSNKIQVQYRIIIDATSERAHGGSATIGIENSTGTAGVQYAWHNPAAISTGKAISFTPSGPTYTMDANAMYDGVILTTNPTLPEPGIPQLLSPPQDAVIGSDHTFEWSESGNSASYTLLISHFSDIGAATSYNAGSALSYNVTGLTLDTTYYWGVFATNSTGTTWCEIQKFTTSSTPPLAAVPQTVWVEQGLEKTIKLSYTGGDASAKTAIITSLPAEGLLYQYVGGLKGDVITSVPANVTDAGRNLIYEAIGGAGNGAGNFNFRMHDNTGYSPVSLVTVNVSPPGMPNLLYTGKTSTYVEMQFDRTMYDPSGNESQFIVTVNGAQVAITTLALKAGDPYTIIATLTSPISLSDPLTISYTAGTVTSIQGGWLASFTAQEVTLLAQTITFNTDLDRKYNESPFTLSATASSGLSMTYSSSYQTVATISGSIVTLRALGTSVITARQAGNTTYAPAKYLRTLTVSIGDQTITFNSIPEKTVGEADFSPGATVSSGLIISYTSSNTAVASIIGGLIHIVGTGTSVINASQAGNELYNAATPVNQTLTVSYPTGKTLNLTSVMLQGLYAGAGIMRQSYDEYGPHWPAGIADHITVELHSASGYSTIIYTVSDVPLNINGTASASIPIGYSGTYYIAVKHRNSIETVSATAQSFAGSTINQSFGAPANVYAGNLVQMADLHYAIFGGDVNQDNVVDLSDSAPVDNQAALAGSGYIPEDINSDGVVDLSDFVIIDNNSTMAIGAITP